MPPRARRRSRRRAPRRSTIRWPPHSRRGRGGSCRCRAAIPSTAAITGLSTVVSVFRKRMTLSPIASFWTKPWNSLTSWPVVKTPGHAGDQKDADARIAFAESERIGGGLAHVGRQRVVLLQPVETDGLHAVGRSRPSPGHSCGSLLHSPPSLRSCCRLATSQTARRRGAPPPLGEGPARPRSPSPQGRALSSHHRLGEEARQRDPALGLIVGVARPARPWPEARRRRSSPNRRR